MAPDGGVLDGPAPDAGGASPASPASKLRRLMSSSNLGDDSQASATTASWSPSRSAGEAPAQSPGGASSLDVFAALYAPKSSIKDRFPGLEGLLLLDRIFECYQVGPIQTLHFYDAEGAQQLVGHPCNVRAEAQTELEYAKSIEQFGNVSECRGIAIAQLSKGGVPPFQMLTDRQLSKGVYIAHRRSPTNPLVMKTIQRGIPSSRCLTSRTPRDVAEWLKQWFNGFHLGSSTSFIEVIELVPTVDADWKAHTTLKGWSKRTAGAGDSSYGARKWQWASQRYDAFKQGALTTRDGLESATSLQHILQAFGWQERLLNTFRECVKFHELAGKHQTVLMHMHKLAVAFGNTFVHSIDMDSLGIIATGSFLLMVPSWDVERYPRACVMSPSCKRVLFAPSVPRGFRSDSLAMCAERSTVWVFDKPR